MKTIKALAVAFLLTASFSSISNARTIDDPHMDLRKAITKLLKAPNLNTSLDESVRISFFVTADEELVVLKTDARTKSLDEFIKSRLNYHSINVKDLEFNRIFHLKVHFKLYDHGLEE